MERFSLSASLVAVAASAVLGVARATDTREVKKVTSATPIVELSAKARDFLSITELQLGRYHLKEGDQSACPAGEFWLLDLGAELTLMDGARALIYAIGLPESTSEERACRVSVRSSVARRVIRMQLEESCMDRAGPRNLVSSIRISVDGPIVKVEQSLTIQERGAMKEQAWVCRLRHLKPS